jgi:hypothetical protein
MRCRRLLAACFVTSVTLSAAAPGAIAQANCDLYGKLALGQQQQNEELKCGFTGSAWSPDLKTHKDWCASVSPDRWKVELQNRQQQLDACKSK